MNTIDIINSMFSVKSGDNTSPLLLNITRDQMLLLFKEAGFKYGAEIGVQKGRFSRLMFEIIPGLKLKCVDIWRRNYNTAKKMLAEYDAELIRMGSERAVKKIPNSSLDFVYIDAAHDFDNAIIDIIKWSPKVKHGGIVAGHDYIDRTHHYQYGVIEAVNSYTKSHNIRQWFLTRDIKKSWFWVVS